MSSPILQLQIFVLYKRHVSPRWLSFTQDWSPLLPYQSKPSPFTLGWYCLLPYHSERLRFTKGWRRLLLYRSKHLSKQELKCFLGTSYQRLGLPSCLNMTNNFPLHTTCVLSLVRGNLGSLAIQFLHKLLILQPVFSNGLLVSYWVTVSI